MVTLLKAPYGETEIGRAELLLPLTIRPLLLEGDELQAMLRIPPPLHQLLFRNRLRLEFIHHDFGGLIHIKGHDIAIAGEGEEEDGVRPFRQLRLPSVFLPV